MPRAGFEPTVLESQGLEIYAVDRARPLGPAFEIHRLNEVLLRVTLMRTSRQYRT